MKLPLYPESGVPEVWIVETKAQVVRAHSHPVEEAYRDVRSVGRGERLAPLAFLDYPLPVDDILG